MDSIDFAKYEGLGNSFVLLDHTQQATSPPAVLPLQQRQWLCSRQHGIGADGVLSLLTPGKQSQAAVYMHVTNADGTTAATCGNGLRCVALWLQQQGKIAAHQPCAIATDSGLRAVHFTPAGICINMGAARIDNHRSETGSPAHTAGNLVNMGNAHLVIQQHPCPKQAAAIGECLTSSKQIGHGINVALYELTQPNQMHLCVYEHGAGGTWACGSGACAAVACAIAAGKLQQNQDIIVEQSGGCLTIRQDNQGQMWMRGPARKICAGTAWLPSCA